VNELNNVNVNYLKIPKKHPGRPKRSRGPHMACGALVWDPWCRTSYNLYEIESTSA